VTDRVDGKVASVPIATYAYRHEAEFAAGFLDDAGIAYRLQVDDAAMTMAMGTSATLWVRGIDVPAAREVLELPSGGKVGTLARPRDAERGRPAEPPSPRRAAALQGIGPHAPGAPALRDSGLSWFERVVAVLLSMGLAGVGSLLPTSGVTLALAVPIAVLAIVLCLSGLVGRAVAPIRALLRALSGNA
jgi:hypothetical protein